MKEMEESSTKKIEELQSAMKEKDAELEKNKKSGMESESKINQLKDKLQKVELSGWKEKVA
jgi:hypothetical protein